MKIFFIIVFLSSTVALAQTGGSTGQGQPAPVVDPVAQAISAQVQVTKQNLQNVMDQLGKINTSGVYNDPDYNRMAPFFKNNVNNAMVRFDLTMTQDILPRAQKWLDQFKQYADPNSKDAPYVQAAADNTRMNLEVVNRLYYKALQQLVFDGVGAVPASGNFEMVSLPKNRCNNKDVNGSGIRVILSDFMGALISPPSTAVYCAVGSYYFDSDGGALSFWFSKLHGSFSDSYQEIVIKDLSLQISKTWAGDCHTEDCKQLRYNDLINYVELVDRAINHPIQLLTYLGQNFGFARYSKLVSENFRYAIQEDLGEIK